MAYHAIDRWTGAFALSEVCQRNLPPPLFEMVLSGDKITGLDSHLSPLPLVFPIHAAASSLSFRQQDLQHAGRRYRSSRVEERQDLREHHRRRPVRHPHEPGLGGQHRLQEQVQRLL